MARSNRRVFQIASLAGCTVDEALLALRGVGIQVGGENDLVPKNSEKQALDAVRAAAFRNRVRLIEFPEAKAPAEAPRLRRAYRSDLIGHPDKDISYLNANEVKDIHWRLVQDFAKTRDPIEPPGLRDMNLLESALHRVHTVLGSEKKYPTVPMAGAAYLHALINDHAFHNGNKRTALVSTLVFLDMNGQVLMVQEDELYSYLIRIADHKIIENPGTTFDLCDREMGKIANWIHANTRPVSNQERILKFYELRRILNQYRCTFEQPSHGNRININRDRYSTQVYYRNEGTDVERNTIRKIRTDLHLMDGDGYDSTVFYNQDQRIPDFINKYRRTLRRLAKV